MQRALLAWFDRHGRRDLPWKDPATPYRVWVSEIMLQQTQVATVVPYFQRFMARFPSLTDLATAPLDEVLALWSGLGYYARARNLHACARRVVAEHGGELPRDLEALMDLPGIGRSTAGAILAQAHGLPHPILDGNVKRVLARLHALPGWPGKASVARRLWALAEAYTPRERVADYTQAIMDLGATVCTRTRPRCDACPLAEGCAARRAGTPTAFPEARPRRRPPQRETHWLVVEDGDGRILLQRRPESGLWGGLWTPPEVPAGEEAGEWGARVLGLRLGAIRTLPAIDHAFTHFRLRIHPLHARMEGRAEAVMEPTETLWYKSGPNDTVGLPRPVRTLLTAIERGTT